MAQFRKGEGVCPWRSPNKVTADLREWISNFTDSDREQIQRDRKTLNPKDRILLFEKLFKYAVPTLQSANLITDFDREDGVIRVIKDGKPRWNKQQEMVMGNIVQTE